MQTQDKTFAPIRFEQVGEMRLAGLRQHYTFEEMGKIPQLWERFIPMAEAAQIEMDQVFYGLMIGNPDQKSFDYMCAVPFKASTPPEGMVAYEVPAHKYAVFTHPGSTLTLEQTIDKIFQSWLPGSNLELALNPDFLERYGPGFNPETMSGDIEIWVPIK